MTNKPQSGFRFVPWRFSWRNLVLVFLIFLTLNYGLVHYCSRQALLRLPSDSASIKSIQAALSDQSQQLQNLHEEIEHLRTTSSSQRATIQGMQKIVDAAGAKLKSVSGELDKLRQSNDQVFRVVDDQEKAVIKIEDSLAQVKKELQEVKDTMQRSGLSP